MNERALAGRRPLSKTINSMPSSSRKLDSPATHATAPVPPLQGPVISAVDAKRFQRLDRETEMVNGHAMIDDDMGKVASILFGGPTRNGTLVRYTVEGCCIRVIWTSFVSQRSYSKVVHARVSRRAGLSNDRMKSMWAPRLSRYRYPPMAFAVYLNQNVFPGCPCVPRR